MTWDKVLTLLRIVHETAANPDPRFTRFHSEASRLLMDVADVKEIGFGDETPAEAEEE